MTDEEFAELEELREKWVDVFGELMPWGFQIQLGQFPMLRRCIEGRSKQPLIEYTNTLGKRLY